MSEPKQPDQPNAAPEREAADAEGREGLRRDRPRIYVASLADYNAGRLHGEWLDATMSAEQLTERTQAMLARSSEPIAEEWAIHDYEGFGPVRLDEHETFEAVLALASGMAEHGAAFAAWATLVDWRDTEELRRYEEAYLGTWPSAQDYAEELLDGVGANRQLEEIEGWLRPYVTLDVESFARDLEFNGDIAYVEDDHGVHVFDTRW